MKSLSLVTVVFLVACGAKPAVAPGPADAVARVKAKYPDATPESVERGRATFTAKCSQCHPLPPGDKVAADKWPVVLKEMTAKAKLGDDDAKAVTEYVLGAVVP